jgi:hypothetical protein
MRKNRAISRVMWFFAIAYAVEGIGHAKSGILGQPITYYLKQVEHWDPVKISVALAALGRFYQSASFARAAGEAANEVRFVFGVRAWF